MENKDLYSNYKNNFSSYDFKFLIIIINIITGVVLLFLGSYITFCLLAICEQIVYQPENVPIITNIFSNESARNVLKISNQGDTVIIENGLLYQIFVLILILSSLYHIIGRVVISIFKIAYKMLNTIEVVRKSDTDLLNKKNKDQQKTKKDYWGRFMSN